MKHIVITGGTGFIGSYLVGSLKNRYKLTILSRNASVYKNKEGVDYAYWDGKSLITDILDGVFAVINLAGENIGGKRWTKVQKNRILQSRADTALAIKESIEKCINEPKLWIQASATGYYGNNDLVMFDEDSPKGTYSFLADVCMEWERSVKELSPQIKTRTVIIRTGVVLSSKTGILKQLISPFDFLLAVIPGRGKQYLPWIHIEDEIRAIYFLLEHESCSGIFNLTAPANTPLVEVARSIKKHYKCILTIYIPKFILKIIFGKRKTNELILVNQSVHPSRILQVGFSFKYDSIQVAIDNLLK